MTACRVAPARQNCAPDDEENRDVIKVIAAESHSALVPFCLPLAITVIRPNVGDA